MEIGFWLIFFTSGLVLLGVCGYFLIRIFSDLQSARGGAPFVGVPLKVARQALKLAAVSKEDTFFDLGCGDGRVLEIAIKEFGVLGAVGYEIGIWPYLKAKLKSQISNLKSTTQSSKLEIHRRDLFKADLKKAAVVFLYLYPQLLEKLKQKLKNELPEEARVIVVTWGFDHPFGRPYLEKIIPWQPQPFKISVFPRNQI